MRTSESAWSALSGVPFVLLWVVAYLVLGKTVESRDPDADILAYFGDGDQRARVFIALVLLVVASLPFIVFISVLRSRLEYAEAGAGVWTMAAYGGGLVSTVLWIVAAALYAVPGLASNQDGFGLDPDTFRLLNDAGFVIWVSAGTIMSVPVLATSVLGLRVGVPRWLSWAGFVVAAALLATFTVLPVMLLLAWVLAVSIVLWRRDVAEAPEAPA